MMGELNSEIRVTLTQLQTQLGNGPIFIGESHTTHFAREAVIKLIESDHVNKLFLELPYVDVSDEKELKEIKDAINYLTSVPRDENIETKQTALELINMSENAAIEATRREKNPISFRNLVEAALQKENIAIYFHDSSIIGQTFIIEGKECSAKYAATIKGVRGRNHDSANIIKRYGLKARTIILAGVDHLDPEAHDESGSEMVTLGQENTLQTLLEYGNDRAFDLSTEEPKQIGQNEQIEIHETNVQNNRNKCCNLF